MRRLKLQNLVWVTVFEIFIDKLYMYPLPCVRKLEEEVASTRGRERERDERARRNSGHTPYTRLGGSRRRGWGVGERVVYCDQLI